MSELARSLVSLPTVGELLDDPVLAYGLPVDAARKLLLRCGSLAEALRVAASPAITTPDHSGAELLDSRGVACEIGKSPSWVQHNLHRLPRPMLVGSSKRWRRADIRAWKGTA